MKRRQSSRRLKRLYGKRWATDMSNLSTTDFRVESVGSIALLILLTKAARDWADQYLPKDRMLWGGCVVIEPRYVANIVTGMLDDGLTTAEESAE